MAVGGSIESVTIRGRILPVPADVDANMKLGGFENEVKANGNGSARLIKLRVPWSVNGLKVEIDHNRSDLEFLKEIADGQDFVPMAITYASGFTYQGKGQIVSEVQASSMDASCELSLSGPGDATQQ